MEKAFRTKTYARFVKIALDCDAHRSDEAGEAFVLPEDCAHAAVLGGLLRGAFGEENEMLTSERNADDSSFGIELYLIISGFGLFADGLYHYERATHALSALWSREIPSDELATLFSSRISRFPIICMITARAYGGFLEDAEAVELVRGIGAICANLSRRAHAIGWTAVALPRPNSEEARSLLDIDGAGEECLHAVGLSYEG